MASLGLTREAVGPFSKILAIAEILLIEVWSV